MMDITTKTYRIALTSDLLGTVPKDPEVYRSYIETKRPENGEDDTEYLNVEKIEEKGWTGFMKDDKGLFLYSYMILGFLKNASEVLKHQIKVTKTKKGEQITEGLKAGRSKIDKYLFIKPRKVYLGKEAPDGVVERPLRAMTAQGPRVSLARSDYIAAGTELEFELTLLKNPELSWDIIDKLWEYGQYQGLGQWRSGGNGRFELVQL